MSEEKALELEHAKKRLYFEKATWVLFSLYVAMAILVWEDKLDMTLGVVSITALGAFWYYISREIFQDLENIEDSIQEI